MLCNFYAFFQIIYVTFFIICLSLQITVTQFVSADGRCAGGNSPSSVSGNTSFGSFDTHINIVQYYNDVICPFSPKKKGGDANGRKRLHIFGNRSTIDSNLHKETNKFLYEA